MALAGNSKAAPNPVAPTLTTLALRFDGSACALSTTPLLPPATTEHWCIIRVSRASVATPDLSAATGLLRFTGTLGHECVGTVEHANTPESASWLGKRVVVQPIQPCGSCERCKSGLSNHCAHRSVMGLFARDGCIAERVLAPISALCEVPKPITDDAACFASSIASITHALAVSRIEGKPFVTILGDGPMGLIAAQLMARRNASVRLLGKHPEKFTLCERWGIKHRHVAEVGRRQDQDVVIDATGSPLGVGLAMQLCRPRGKVVVLSTPAPVPANALASVHPGPDLSPITINELELVGARGGHVREGLAALAAHQVDVLPLITKRFPLQDAAKAIAFAKDASTIRVLIEP